MNKRKVAFGGSIIIICLLIWGIGMGGKKKEEKLYVEVKQAQLGSIEKTVTLSGAIFSLQSQEIVVPAGQKVTQLFVSENQMIEKDQPLLQVDTQELTLQLKRLQSNKNALQTDIEKLEVPNTRYEKESLENAVKQATFQNEAANLKLQTLKNEYEQKSKQYYDGAIPEGEFLKANSALQDAKTQYNITNLVLQNAKNQLNDYPLQMREKIRTKRDQLNLINVDIETIQKKLTDSTIVSPIAGTVVNLPVKLNDLVTSQNNIIVVQDNNKFKFVTYVSQEDATNLKLGQKATIRIKNTSLAYQGSISYLQSALLQDPKTPTANPKLKMEIVIQPPYTSLLSGYQGEAEVILGMTPSVVNIHNEAIRKDNKGIGFVYLVENNKVRKQSIETGIYNDRLTEVKSGLQTKQTYILNPSLSIKEGMEISVVQK